MSSTKGTEIKTTFRQHIFSPHLRTLYDNTITGTTEGYEKPCLPLRGKFVKALAMKSPALKSDTISRFQILLTRFSTPRFSTPFLNHFSVKVVAICTLVLPFVSFFWRSIRP
ncbi:hypothetical protein LXL04_003064 [Taraxacum kok-saghyz]